MKSINTVNEESLIGHTISEDSKIIRIVSEKSECISMLSDFFKIVSDSTRLRILMSVFSKPLCVLEISRLLDMSTSCVSHQLKTLKSSNFVEAKRVGKNVYYSIVNCHVREIIEMALAHIEEKH